MFPSEALFQEMATALRVGLALALLALALASLHGWGRRVSRYAGLPPLPWALTAAIGMAALIAVGGLLNLARLAIPLALDAIFVIGLGFFALDLACRWNEGERPRWPGLSRFLALAVPWVLVVAAAVFVAWTQVPPRAYNVHDDYLKYFAHPVRMLATGTVLGSPYSSMGVETLGGQAFLQGFVLSHFPVSMLNAVDAFGCAVLLMALLVSWAQRRGSSCLLVTLALSLALVINPQYVNISGLYSVAAMICAALLLASLPGGGFTGPEPSLRTQLPLALLLAASVVIKPTHVPFLVLCTVSLGACTMLHRGGRAAGAWLARFSLLVAAAVAPWLLLHLPRYLASAGAAVHQRGALVGDMAARNILDPTALRYGDSLLHYTAVFSLPLLAALFTLPRDAAGRSAPGTPVQSALLSFGLSAFAAYALSLELLATTFGDVNAIRFMTALAIATAPAALLLGTELLAARSGRAPRLLRHLLAALAVASLALFWPDFGQRLHQAWTRGSIIAFRPVAVRPDYLEYNRAILNEPARQKVVQVQGLVPAGEPILAWMNAPFYLDFRRNPILDVELAGLTNRGGATPPTRYVYWSYRGFAIKSLKSCQAMADNVNAGWIVREGGRECVRWKLLFQQARSTAAVVFDDGESVLLKTDQPLRPPQGAARQD